MGPQIFLGAVATGRLALLGLAGLSLLIAAVAGVVTSLARRGLGR